MIATMARPIRLSASILAADFTRLGHAIAQAEAGGTDWIHIDVMDGHFVPNLSMGPVVVAACRRATPLPLDVHLMIEQPERMLQAFIEAGASVVSVHVEACPDVGQVLRQIRRLGAKAGIALSPDTPADAILSSLADADLVLAMTVPPGHAGQTFMPQVLPKVTHIRQAIVQRGLSTDIEVDGGIDLETAPQARQAGANVFVSAQAIFGAGGDIARATANLKQALRDSRPASAAPATAD